MNPTMELKSNTLSFGVSLKDSSKFKNFVVSNKRELAYWGLLLVAVGIIYSSFSNGEFSFSYTLSAIIQFFGFFLISRKVKNSRSVSGLSLNTFICYSLSIFSKLFCIIFFEAYLPGDPSGEFIYRVSEALAFIASLSSLVVLIVSYVIAMVYLIAKKFKATYNREDDKISCLVLIIPTLIVACLVHPSLNDTYIGDIPWTFGCYLESVAMFPQLYMLSKKGGVIEAVTSHFVASQGFSKCLALIFWVGCYDEVNEVIGTTWSLFQGQTGYIVVLFQIIQVLLFSDFLYEYVKSLRKGLPMTLDGYIVI